jgi:alkylated DNA repair dioxygenase AlkB
VPFDGELYLVRQFYQQPEAELLFSKLNCNLAWQEESIFIFGKWVKVPRLMCWIGDVDASYRYSGVTHQPIPWTEDLQAVRERIEHQYCYRFNSVLANLYRDGQDSMGCHADDEKELGINPSIASLNFGAQRVLRFRHARLGLKFDVPLAHGDLLIMAGELQHHWKHELPKTRKVDTPRINLTFRWILGN